MKPVVCGASDLDVLSSPVKHVGMSRSPALPGEFAPLSIGNLKLEVPVVLAPMAGITNVPFRTLCRQFGAGLYVSEMLGARAIAIGDQRTLELAEFGEDETIRSIQLYATDAEAAALAAKRLVTEGAVDHIDMNFGCPAPKVTRHGGGAALPFKTRLYGDIVSQTVKAAGDVPVTVKFRKGIDDDHITFLDAGRIAEDAGAAAVALHARTAEQLYSGQAAWEAIAELKEAVTTVPVLGNGDIWEGYDAVRMMRETGCDGVVVGRGCLGRPWLFRELTDVFSGRDPQEAPNMRTVSEIMLDHAALLVDRFGEHRGIRSFRKHSSWYLKGFVAGKDIRRDLHLVESVEAVRLLLDKIDLDQEFPEDAARMGRGHMHGPKKVKLPAGYLDTRETEALPVEASLAVSGG